MPELRRDPITGEWVVIASERARRPSDFANRSRGSEPVEDVTRCPFCPGNEAMTPPELLAFRHAGGQRNGPGWWVRVVPNKFPALAVEGELEKAGFGMYDWMNGVGAHEVLIETPEHARSLARLDDRQVEDVLWAYRARYLDLKQDPRLKYILLFRNHGRVAGASLSHPHSQLIATPMVPGAVAAEMAGAKRYESYRERCVYCDIVNQERTEGSRVVIENESFLVFEPYASKYPFETWVVPKRHGPSFAAISAEEQASFARTLREALYRIYGVLDDPPYNFTIHTAPCNSDDRPDYHWHLEIFPRLTIAAGFEMGTGIYINVTPPEVAARYLREFAVETPEAAPRETVLAE